MTSKRSGEILLVFSDLDGTLIHYPEKIPEDSDKILKLPTSSTGMKGIISSKTLTRAQEVRERGSKFILVSGMRASTLFKRLPYLPRADAYAVEAGGRIFYPREHSKDNLITVNPEKYDGAKEEELVPFGLVEDTEWRQRMEKYCGTFEVENPASISSTKSGKTANERDGLLWEFGRHLIEKGYVLDTNGYSSCFRVNKRHQVNVSDDEFEALKNGRVQLLSGLARSVNMNCVDIYPAISGKKNCCQYLAEKFYPDEEKSVLLSEKALCICDDDNDIEMAMACKHAFIPSISSKSMADLIRQNPNHFTLTLEDSESEGDGTKASETALDLILDRITNA